MLPVFISVCRWFQETLPTTKEWEHTQLEQLGTFDPHVNVHGEKLVSLNIERILYWLAQVPKSRPWFFTRFKILNSTQFIFLPNG